MRNPQRADRAAPSQLPGAASLCFSEPQRVRCVGDGASREQTHGICPADPATIQGIHMRNIFYIIGVVVVVIAILSLAGIV